MKRLIIFVCLYINHIECWQPDTLFKISIFSTIFCSIHKLSDDPNHTIRYNIFHYGQVISGISTLCIGSYVIMKTYLKNKNPKRKFITKLKKRV